MNGAKCLFVGDFRLKINEIMTALEAFKAEEGEREQWYLWEIYRAAIVDLGAAHSRLKEIEEIYNADVEGGGDA